MSESIRVPVSEPSRSRRPRWHLIYYLLAVFDVFTVSMSLFLTHRIMTIYTRSVEDNQAWADVLRDTSELGEWAARVNAPGNDVFATSDGEGESRKLTEAVNGFQGQAERLRGILAMRADAVRAELLLADLSAVQSATATMVGEAELIFAALRRNNRDQAGMHMAEMDRRYDSVNKALSHLRHNVAAIQKEHFDEQTAAAGTLQRSEFGIAALILLMVGGATLYGHKIARMVESDAREKECYQESLRQAHDELEERVIERTQELLKTNEALRESEERYRDLIESTHDLVQSVTPDGRFLFVNRAWLQALGYSPAEVPRLNLFQIIHPSSLAHCRELFRRVLAGEAVENLEADFVSRDGRLIRVEGNATGRYQDGKLIATQGFFRDTTERQRAAEVRKRLLGQVMTAQEAERRRIARDLHDEIGQSLTSLMIGLRAVEGAATREAAQGQASELRRIAGHTLDEVRRLARGLRPAVLDDLGLAAALERTAMEFTQAHGVPVRLDVAPLQQDRLPEAVETALYRIVQEALTNVAKHAAARHVHIAVEREPSAVRAVVADDGCGFNPDALMHSPSTRAHLGLSGMHERAALLKGSVTIASSPGNGTRVCVCVPLAEENHGEDPGPDCR